MYLTCPVCGGKLKKNESTYTCPLRHSFDIAKQARAQLPATAPVPKAVSACKSYVPKASDLRDLPHIGPVQNEKTEADPPLQSRKGPRCNSARALPDRALRQHIPQAPGKFVRGQATARTA